MLLCLHCCGCLDSPFTILRPICLLGPPACRVAAVSASYIELDRGIPFEGVHGQQQACAAAAVLGHRSCPGPPQLACGGQKQRPETGACSSRLAIAQPAWPGLDTLQVPLASLPAAAPAAAAAPPPRPLLLRSAQVDEGPDARLQAHPAAQRHRKDDHSVHWPHVSGWMGGTMAVTEEILRIAQSAQKVGKLSLAAD